MSKSKIFPIKLNHIKMLIFNTINALRQYLNQERINEKSVGFVPTMGALHVGHLSLIDASKKDNDLTVCSIFVNPTQFNNPDDLARYPRTLEADCAMLEPAGCDVVFAPSTEEIYTERPVMKFDFGDLETVMEGKFRPGHFNGVGIVVSKLFNIIQPNRTYFGQKDLQQTAVIGRMMKDMSYQIEFNICPTLRETDGLAMSSRNRNLLPEHRAVASEIFKLLSGAKKQLLDRKPVSEVLLFGRNYLKSFLYFELEYFEIVNAFSLQNIDKIQPITQNAICVAAYLGKIRLIDNFVF